jgi:hypothetical protein
LEYRKRLLERFTNLFSGGTGNQKQQNFGKKWGWYSILMSLCNEDVLKLNDASKISIEQAFTFMSYKRDQDRIKK